MTEKIVQLNEEVIKGQIKELVRGPEHPPGDDRRPLPGYVREKSYGPILFMMGVK